MINFNRWNQFSFAQQMGNIGSEITRACNWEDRGDVKLRNEALERALDLIDLTIEIPHQNQKNKLREMTRFREVVCDWYCNTHCYDINPRQLADYCIRFSLVSV